MIVGTTDAVWLSGQPESDATADRTKNLSEALDIGAARFVWWCLLLTQHVKFFEARMLLETLGKGQAKESMWGMPGHIEAMKAAVSCDKLGGAAHTH